MKTNVGEKDQKVRSVVGPALLAAGVWLFKGRKRGWLGLATAIAGVVITETAFTRTCPVNHLLGVHTA